MKHLPPVVERFLRYVQIDTQSNPDSQTIPSTERQKDLGTLLVSELKSLGIADAFMDDYGYVFATLPARYPSDSTSDAPVLGLLAHLDTSPDASGTNVTPVIHTNYDGGVITLPGDTSVTLDPQKQPALLDHIGHDIITSDGTTLLGSDDKAGVAILMQLAEDLLADSDTFYPQIRLCFTIDEEIGRGVDHLDLKVFGVDVAYTIDGSGTDTVFAETFNATQARLDIEGTMVHPGYAKGIMVNAARILSQFIASLPDEAAPESTAGHEGYIHPHGIDQSDPSKAGASFILRNFEEKGLEDQKEYLRSLAQFFRVKFPQASIELTFQDQYKNMRSYIEQRDQRVITLAHQAASNMGIELQEQVIRGGTDGARLSELGIPTPNIFNGGYDYHSCFEWNTVQNLETSLTYLKHLVYQWSLET